MTAVSVDTLLGEACWSVDVARRVVDGMPALAVEDAVRRPVWLALTALVAADLPIDPTTVLSRVIADHEPGWDQAVRHLSEIAVGGYGAGSVSHHLDVVQEAAARHRLSLLGVKAQQAAGGVDVADAVQLIREGLDGIQTKTRNAPPLVADLMQDHMERLETVDTSRVLPTGLHDLDHALGGGFRPGQLVIVGAQSGVGKSLLLTGFARHATFEQRAVTQFHSLEMSNVELMDRIFSAEAKVSLTKITGRDLDDDDWSRIAGKVNQISLGRWHIDDNASRTVADIRATDTPQRPNMIVVDYLQLVTPSKGDNRQEQVAMISRGLKALARDLRCVVVAAAQLNRAAEARQDKRPRMADLRESGAVGQDADTVLLLDRADADETLGTTARLIVAKQRGGPQGAVIDLTFSGHYARFDTSAWRPS